MALPHTIHGPTETPGPQGPMSSLFRRCSRAAGYTEEIPSWASGVPLWNQWLVGPMSFWTIASMKFLYQLYPIIKPPRWLESNLSSSTKMGIVVQVITVDLLAE